MLEKDYVIIKNDILLALEDNIEDYNNDMIELWKLAEIIFEQAILKQLIQMKKSIFKTRNTLTEAERLIVRQGGLITDMRKQLKDNYNNECIEYSYCDMCNTKTLIKKLARPENTGVFLCEKCWKKEMLLLELKNEDLTKENKWEIIKWEDYDCKKENP
jgi:Mg2+ and Co2+ transporter CorA